MLVLGFFCLLDVSFIPSKEPIRRIQKLAYTLSLSKVADNIDIKITHAIIARVIKFIVSKLKRGVSRKMILEKMKEVL